MKRLSLVLLILLSTQVSAQQTVPSAGTHISFSACPIARDTGPDTDLCFIAEHQGVRYALTNPADWGQAQLKHRVLVEGKVVDGPLVCGALPLDGRFSILTKLDLSCDQILPFDGEIVGRVGGIFNRGTPEQRAAAIELAERAEENPELSILPANPEPPAAQTPVPPFEPQRLTVYFPFNSDRGSGPDMLNLVNLVRYAEAAAASMYIRSYQGETLLSAGGAMVESDGMAQQRAEKMAAIVKGLGMAEDRLQVEWEEDAISGDGSDDWKNRRVEFYIEL